MIRFRFPTELTAPETDGIFRQQAANTQETMRDTRKAVILFDDVSMILNPFKIIIIIK